MNRTELAIALAPQVPHSARVDVKQFNAALTSMVDTVIGGMPLTNEVLLKQLLNNNRDDMNTAEDGELTVLIKVPGGISVGLAIESEDFNKLFAEPGPLDGVTATAT